jgi:hypothetical protein
MARAFDDGSSQYLGVASAVVTAPPLTISAWFNSDDVTATQGILSICDASSTVIMWRLIAAGAAAGDNVKFVARDAAATGTAAATGAFTAGTWYHACGIEYATNSRAAFYNGGGKGTNVTNVAVSGVDRTGIGALYDLSPSNYMSGLIAEVTVWKAALTDREVKLLALGVPPWLIRRGSIAAYWPLQRQWFQDRDIGGRGYNMSPVNAPTWGVSTPHIPAYWLRRIMESNRRIAKAPAVAADALPMAWAQYRRRFT